MTNSSHRQIARAAAVVMITFIASRVLGLARDIVISAHYGTSDALDAYYAASRLNDLIFTLIAGGALASAFIPTFASYLARDDEPGAWRIASHIINILLIALSIVSLLAAIFAAPIVSGLLGIGFDPAKHRTFHTLGDGQFHVYRIWPFWHAAKKIIRLRVDPPDAGQFEIQWIRVVEKEIPVSSAKKWTRDEIARLWRSSEDVDAEIDDGTFGMALERDEVRSGVGFRGVQVFSENDRVEGPGEAEDLDQGVLAGLAR